MSKTIFLTFALILTFTVSSCSLFAGSDDYQKQLAEQEELLRRQELEKKRQEREIQNLKRQKYYNDYLEKFEKK